MYKVVTWYGMNCPFPQSERQTLLEKELQPRRIKSSQSPERKLRCCRTGLCLFFANFFRQPYNGNLLHF